MNQDILNTITIEDIKHPDLRLIAERCGLEVAIKFYQNLRGITISIPNNALREFQESFILQNKSKYRTKELALMLSLNERTVEQIIIESKVKAQTNLFDNITT